MSHMSPPPTHHRKGEGTDLPTSKHLSLPRTPQPFPHPNIHFSFPPSLHDCALATGVLLAGTDAPAPAAVNVHDHADLVRVVASGHQARGTQALHVHELRRLARHPVPELRARVEALARPARLVDVQPVVPAVAAAEVWGESGRLAGLYAMLLGIL